MIFREGGGAGELDELRVRGGRGEGLGEEGQG